MKSFKNIISLLSSKERKSFVWLLITILIMAFVETLGVASIFPFIAILTNPLMVETNIFLNKLFQLSKFFGVENNQHFFFLLGSCVFLILIISIILKVYTEFLQIRFVKMLEYSVGKSLMENYLNQPYSWFLNHNSNELIKNILSEVDHVIGNAIFPFAQMIAKGTVAVSLLGLLIFTDIKLALSIAFSIGGIYGLIFYFLKNFIKRIGTERLKNNHLRYRVVGQTFGSIKELKISGSEKLNLQIFSNSGFNYARSEIYAHLTGTLPRFILEGIAFAGIMSILLFLIAQKGSMITALPIISLYVFAGYRLMPSLQQVYFSFTSLKYSSPSLNALSSQVKKSKSFLFEQDSKILPFDKKISLNNVNYSYPNTSSLALREINLSISPKSVVGFVGPSGSGKTTTVDIILGLLEPQNGTLEIDGKVITKTNARAWQRSIGYVPQHIYLLDDTIINNIAFGVDEKDINQNSVYKACKTAKLDELIDELPEKYNTIIGEGGIRLSGGQRQRIGIARALYNNPRILILDEATSALDYETEQIVMNAINNLGKNITIILIAHRMNTLEKCDTIFKLEKGKIVFQGNFDELMTYNKSSS